MCHNECVTKSSCAMILCQVCDKESSWVCDKESWVCDTASWVCDKESSHTSLSSVWQRIMSVWQRITTHYTKLTVCVWHRGSWGCDKESSHHECVTKNHPTLHTTDCLCVPMSHHTLTYYVSQCVCDNESSHTTTLPRVTMRMSHVILSCYVPSGVSNVDLTHHISVSKETYKRIVCIWKEPTNLLCTTHHAD